MHQCSNRLCVSSQPGFEKLRMLVVRSLVATKRFKMLAHIAVRENRQALEDVGTDELPGRADQRQVEHSVERAHACTVSMGDTIKRLQGFLRDASLLVPCP